MAKKTKKTDDVAPAETMRIDPKTGELCIGDECFSVRINTDSNAITLDMDESSET